MNHSIVIPTFNRAYCIVDSINSALAQSLKSEIIVVDDGSTDETPRVLKNFARNGVRIIRSEVRRGASASRNCGFKASRGEVVIFLDSDDVLVPDRLWSDTQHLIDPSVGAVVYDALAFRGHNVHRNSWHTTKQVGRKYKLNEVSDGYTIDMRALSQFATGSMTLRRELLMRRGANGPFDESCRYEEDFLFEIVSLAGARFYVSAELGSIVRRFDDGLHDCDIFGKSTLSQREAWREEVQRILTELPAPMVDHYAADLARAREEIRGGVLDLDPPFLAGN